MSIFAPGTAPIKAECVLSYTDWFLLIETIRFLASTTALTSAPDDDAAEGGTARASGSSASVDYRSNVNPGGGRQKKTKAEKKAQRGQNKGRRFGKTRDDLDLCWRIANGAVCEFGAEYVSFLTSAFIT